MVKVESECVNCGFPCRYYACPNYEVTKYICDRCGEQDTLYEYNGEELCADCVLDQLYIVPGSEV